MNRWGLGSETSSQCSCFFQVCPSSQGLPSTSVSQGGWTLPFLVLVYTPRPAAILTGLIRNKGFMGYQALWDCLVQLPVSRNQGIYSPPTGRNSSTSHTVPSSVTQAQASPAPCEQTYQDAHPSIRYTGIELQMIHWHWYLRDSLSEDPFTEAAPNSQRLDWRVTSLRMARFRHAMAPSAAAVHACLLEP